jgi:hypothetical protein
MTLLEIKILIHYYIYSTDLPDEGFYDPNIQEAIESLRDKSKLLEPTHLTDVFHDPHYRLTERGYVYLQALLNVPLPIQVWVMPAEPCFGPKSDNLDACKRVNDRTLYKSA